MHLTTILSCTTLLICQLVVIWNVKLHGSVTLIYHAHITLLQVGSLASAMAPYCLHEHGTAGLCATSDKNCFCSEHVLV